MKKITILASLFCSAALMAQNIDPTVEVSREYEGKLIEVHKPAIAMAVPDTLHRFDLDFDYSVFENPYKGSYEFNPYALEMKPSSGLKDRKTFYLRAGAGYTLHPTLDLSWTPLKKGAFSMDFHASHRSYIGEYRALNGRQGWNGHDLLSKAGADFGYDWKKVAVDFGASYCGIADKDYRRQRAYNSLDAYASIRSKPMWPEHFKYNVAVSYRYAADDAGYDPAMRLSGHDFCLDAGFAPNFSGNNKVVFDLGAEMVAYSGALASSVGKFYFIPRYIYTRGVLDLNVGVRISAVTSSGEAFMTKGQIVYPDIRMNVAVIPDAMRLYLHIGGGDRLQTYSSLLERNHHLDLQYGMGAPASLLDVTVERVSAMLGFEGRISGFFSYNLRGGYVNYKSAPLDAALKGDDGLYLPALGYAPYQKCFAALDWDLNVQSLRFDGTVGYQYSWGLGDDVLLLPASLEGDVSLLYDWNGRVYAGVDCLFSTARVSATGFRMPGYADLGAYAEYVMNRKLSFWVRGGNLLNMEIQRNLFYAEKGINFTAGICLSF